MCCMYRFILSFSFLYLLVHRFYLYCVLICTYGTVGYSLMVSFSEPVGMAHRSTHLHYCHTIFLFLLLSSLSSPFCLLHTQWENAIRKTVVWIEQQRRGWSERRKVASPKALPSPPNFKKNGAAHRGNSSELWMMIMPLCSSPFGDWKNNYEGKEMCLQSTNQGTLSHRWHPMILAP